MQRNSASRSPTPATQNGRPCPRCPHALLRECMKLRIIASLPDNCPADIYMSVSVTSTRAVFVSHLQHAAQTLRSQLRSRRRAGPTFVRRTGPSSLGCGSQTYSRTSTQPLGTGKHLHRSLDWVAQRLGYFSVLRDTSVTRVDWPQRQDRLFSLERLPHIMGLSKTRAAARSASFLFKQSYSCSARATAPDTRSPC